MGIFSSPFKRNAYLPPSDAVGSSTLPTGGDPSLKSSNYGFRSHRFDYLQNATDKSGEAERDRQGKSRIGPFPIIFPFV